jgi:hypothetical protein
MTVPAITTLYASCFTLLFAWANWRLFRFSQGLKVPYRHRPEIIGDSVWALLLLLMAEVNGVPGWSLHVFASLVLMTRIRLIWLFNRDLGKWPDRTAPSVLINWALIVAGALGLAGYTWM